MIEVGSMRRIKEKKMDKVGFASTIVMSYSMVFLFIEIVTKFLKGVLLESLLWEIFLLVSMLLLFGFLSKDEVALNVPRSLLGRILPLAVNKKKDRNKRYIIDSMIVSFLIVVINIFIYQVYSHESALQFFCLVEGYELYNFVVNSIFLFGVSTAIIFLFERYVCERNIKLYLQYLSFISREKEEEVKPVIIEKKTKKNPKK